MKTIKSVNYNDMNVAIVNNYSNGVISSKIQSFRSEEEDAFFICDLGDVVKKYNRWCSQLPRVAPYYAVKCNDDPAVLSVLAELGTGFDCASKAEIQKILKMNVKPNRIVYANPCKQTSHIKYAAKHHVQLMTFDNEVELQKVKNIIPDAKLVLRILPPENKKCQCELGMKFGAPSKDVVKLLSRAKELDLNVVGISFHVGSGCYDATAFSSAVELAHTAFEQGKALGFNFTLLDIGGGFPGQESADISFEEICEELRPALDRYFPESSNIEIIAEPGRYFVASAFTLAVNIIGKRKEARDRDDEDMLCSADDEPMFKYFVNDGVYGSFNCLLFDHASVKPTLHNPEDYKDEVYYTSTLWGPTCDGLDCIAMETSLPELNVGNWLVFNDMGAYTISAATTFNGMDKPVCHYNIQENYWKQIVECEQRRRSAHPLKELSCNTPAGFAPAMNTVEICI